jgi:hypothetical protein
VQINSFEANFMPASEENQTKSTAYVFNRLKFSGLVCPPLFLFPNIAPTSMA